MYSIMTEDVSHDELNVKQHIRCYFHYIYFISKDRALGLYLYINSIKLVIKI